MRDRATLEEGETEKVGETRGETGGGGRATYRTFSSRPVTHPFLSTSNACMPNVTVLERSRVIP